MPFQARARVGQARRYKKRYTKRRPYSFKRAVSRVVRQQKETKETVLNVANENGTSISVVRSWDLTDAHWIGIDVSPVIQIGDIHTTMDGCKAYMKNMENILTFHGPLTSGYLHLRCILVQLRNDPDLATLAGTQILYRSDSGEAANNFGYNTPINNNTMVTRVLADRRFLLGPSRVDNYTADCSMTKTLKFFTPLNYVARFNNPEENTGRTIGPRFYKIFIGAFAYPDYTAQSCYVIYAKKWSFKEV